MRAIYITACERMLGQKIDSSCTEVGVTELVGEVERAAEIGQRTLLVSAERARSAEVGFDASHSASIVERFKQPARAGEMAERLVVLTVAGMTATHFGFDLSAVGGV